MTLAANGLSLVMPQRAGICALEAGSWAAALDLDGQACIRNTIMLNELGASHVKVTSVGTK